MKNLITLTVNNHMGRNKGDFIVDERGILSPKTRNPSIWGAVTTKDIFQKEFLFDKNFGFGFGGHSLEEGIPTRLSAFFKFQKSNFNTFAENTGMEIAYVFNSKTSYNCPARLDLSEPSIKEALKEIPNENISGYGSLVFSMLEKNEKIYSLSFILGKDEPTSDIRYGLMAIKNFVKSKNFGKSNEELALQISSLQKEYCFQYLFRDCFGDVDYTSKNSGLIYNHVTGEIRLAPNFDFGEMFAILKSSKLTQPNLIDVNSFPDYLKSMPNIVEATEKANAIKLEKFNMSAYELGAKYPTFGEESLKNISVICTKFPEIALEFLIKLKEFNGSEMLPVLIDETAGEQDEQLISNSEKSLVYEYINGKMDSFEKALIESMQKLAPKEYTDKLDKTLTYETIENGCNEDMTLEE